MNEWQRQHFAALGVTRRDPMSVTMAILLDVEHRASELVAGGSSHGKSSSSSVGCWGGSTGDSSNSCTSNGDLSESTTNSAREGGKSPVLHPIDAELEARVLGLIDAESTRFSREVYKLTVGSSTDATDVAEAAARHRVDGGVSKL